MYDLSDKSLNDCLDVFVRELQKLHNELRTEEDDKNIKEIQKKIALINTILNNLNKFKVLIKIK
jgi:ribosomal protein L29